MKQLMGEDPEVPVPEAQAKAFQEIFKQGKERYITNKDGVAIGKEQYYPNFAVIADRIYAKIANISKEGVVRNTNDEDMQEQLEAGSAGAYMDYVGKESYEMSKLQSVSQKAKFFLVLYHMLSGLMQIIMKKELNLTHHIACLVILDLCLRPKCLVKCLNSSTM